MTLSPFAAHRNYRLRKAHVADIREPLVRAIWYWRYAQRVASDVGPVSSDPDAREVQYDLVEEVDRAMSRCNAILADIRSSRKLERVSSDPMREVA